jgi:NAD+ kinase
VALNDAVIKTAGGYSALHLRLAALGSDLGHLVADGLIAASASGSTAYSLSAGGPVLSQTVEALVVTPVCPHTLGSRSLVLSARDTLELHLLGALDRVLLLLDGQDPVELEAGDDVEIALARTSVRVLDNPARPLARALHAKLGWQGSERRSLR